jgi:hypothetical protein
VSELIAKQTSRSQKGRNKEELNREKQTEKITEVKEWNEKQNEVARTNYNDRT